MVDGVIGVIRVIGVIGVIRVIGVINGDRGGPSDRGGWGDQR